MALTFGESDLSLIIPLTNMLKLVWGEWKTHKFCSCVGEGIFLCNVDYVDVWIYAKGKYIFINFFLLFQLGSIGNFEFWKREKNGSWIGLVMGSIFRSWCYPEKFLALSLSWEKNYIKISIFSFLNVEACWIEKY